MKVEVQLRGRTLFSIWLMMGMLILAMGLALDSLGCVFLFFGCMLNSLLNLIEEEVDE